MQIEYLKIFTEIASAKSISKVANSSHITQPALSQQIQKLEESLGHKLLERSNRGVELTDAGKIVEKYAKIIVKAFEDILEDLENLSDYSTVKIFASPSMATYALPCTMYLIKEQFPNYTLNLTSEFSAAIEQNVAGDICQVGFIHGKPADPSLMFSKVGTDRLVAVAAQDFAIPGVITLKDLVKHPLIMLTDRFEERKYLNNYLAQKGISPDKCNIVMNLDSIESVKATILKGYGLSFIPYISIKKELYTKELKEINVTDFNLNYDIYIIYKKEMDSSKSSKALVQYIKKVGEKSFC
ncbi:MAG TPA: LysR family transcriptional regulator [Ruminiclostridium sp.]|jgi:DNA-binding transcriptional LysR family regulator|nr:LysR family transcriptional regulator [Ruminiclostridium sp.]